MAELAAQPAVPTDLVAVGRVAAAHGVRGWLKIQAYSRQGDALQSAKVWWLAPESESGSLADVPRAVQVLACRAGGSHLLAQVQGIADRDTAQALRGQVISVPRALFPAPAKDEYYWVDLIGCRFWGMADGEPALLGQVDDVLDNGAHAILQVTLGSMAESGAFEPLAGVRGRPRQMLVPFVAAHILRVDLQSHRIDSNWPSEF